MDDDGADDGRGRSTEAQGPAMGPIYMMWENTLEKLKLLNYEKGYCRDRQHERLNRVHFVYPAKNASVQFDEFVDLCSWLIFEITRNPDSFRKDSFDDPTTVCNKLLLALRTVDNRSSFPLQKLKTPHGETVCSVLEMLADKALEKIGFKFSAPVYKDNEEMQQDEPDDNDEDIAEDDVVGDGEDEANFDEFARTELAETSLDNSSHQILQADVDPIKWKTELERVGPKLKAQATLSPNEWRSHIDQTVVNKANIEKILEATNKDIKTMSLLVKGELDRVANTESALNTKLKAFVEEFAEVKKQVEALESKTHKSSEEVSSLTAVLAESNERLEELKESFESKDSGINDTSPLVRIKAALQQIKNEIRAFDLRIGVVSHSLLSSRVAAANEKRRQASQKNRRRRQRGKRHSDDDSIISGEDD